MLSSPPEHEDQLIILVKGWIGVGPSKGVGVGVEEGGELSQVHPAIHLNKVFYIVDIQYPSQLFYIGNLYC